ncbi:hypothetical protein MU582_18830 [Nocardioidaceae bacterium SCSIO 66511]|nr:hypothetical protein MU582_18830 [Nocardioidaceae bacterium SCSIO 66511]
MYRPHRPNAVRTVAASAATLALVASALPLASAEVSATATPDRSTVEQSREDAARAQPSKVIAHRGASAVAPENTMVSFRKAIKRGADWIEMDVQRTKDGRLVVFHDSSLRRTTNVEKRFPKKKRKPIGKFTYKQLRKLDAGRWKAKRYKGAKIPSLKRVLRLGKKRGVKMLVELKNPGRYPGILKKTLRLFRRMKLIKRGHKRDRVQLQSFSIKTMRRAAKRSKWLEVGLLYPDPPVTLKKLRWARNINSYHREVERKYIRRAQRDYNIKVFVWTVNGRNAMKRAIRMNANGIITDRPKRARRITHRRWTPDELRVQLAPYDGVVPLHRA